MAFRDCSRDTLMKSHTLWLILLLASCSAAVGGNPAPGEGSDAVADQCRASNYQYLVGQDRSKIPAAPAGETWRVTCSSCPITMDYSDRRLNILYDERTGIVEQVRCG